MAQPGAALDATVAKFVPLQSCVDVSFWSELADRKLTQYKLSDQEVAIAGWFGPTQYLQVPGQLSLDSASFGTATAAHDAGVSGTGATAQLPEMVTRPGQHVAPGALLNFNTREAFRTLDAQALLRKASAVIWDAICSGAAEANPSLLTHFWLATYAELKHFHFSYWFLFPALKPPAPIMCHAAAPAQHVLGAECAAQVAAACDAARGLAPPASGEPAVASAAAFAWLLELTPAGDARAAPLNAWAELQQRTGSRVLLAVPDTSCLDPHASWVLRNLLLLAAKRWAVRNIEVLCVRDAHGRTSPARSLLLRYDLPPIPADWCAGDSGPPVALGWEANADGRLAPRSLDLSAHMSPHHLAEQAVDLNLHLMKWRAVPELDTARVAATKCLLLGAGTLGCAVARTLLAWGVRRITFLDVSRVSYSNPVRQSLFNFDDCLDGGRPKAQAAADALRRIFPAVHTTGVDVSIPMPGHPPANAGQEAAQREATEQVDALVEQHDAVFLLTDTRESRWLPTLLAAAHNKVAITSAVGFDGFLVMRHGAGPHVSHPTPHGPHSPVATPAHRLGCYFCNDVVAPLNSTRDRTLDQQCTVARPGLAPMAGALAVELLVALLQHPLGARAPAQGSKPPAGGSDNELDGVLGPVPHQIRGQLSGFSQTCMVGHAFSQCTACSATVVDAYRGRGWDFVRQAIQDPGYLENLTGLDALHRQALDMLGSDSSDGEDLSPAGGMNDAGQPGVGNAGDGTSGEQGRITPLTGDDDDEWTDL